ncbi:hypothetical protein [Grimontia sp. NTOU-MAR1]|uniref:hypothetical protein n=1 Tax=Grimontia sp. NTOU-MAR1 TaxID=3111011 RepID=UPI002DBAE463|nr:hypothetical protein [Grimontia sp. NTOU-MAR1]
MARKETKYKDRFDAEYDALTKTLVRAKSKLSALSIEGEKTIDTMLYKLETYQHGFETLVNKRLEVGTTHDSGLKGAARAASHRVEKAIQKIENDKLYIKLLMLKRHEKDFLLRSDTEYINKFNTMMDDFSPAIASSDMPPNTRLAMEAALREYHKAFNAFADGLIGIGLTPQSGLHGTLRASVQEAEKLRS